jgi:hypothetical protein
MTLQFLHMGCDLERSRTAAEQTEGVTLLEQMYAGSKLEAETPQAQKAYFQHYDFPSMVDFMVTEARTRGADALDAAEGQRARGGR